MYLRVFEFALVVMWEPLSLKMFVHMASFVFVYMAVRLKDMYERPHIYIYAYAEVMMYEWACHYLWVALYSARIGLVVA